MIAVNIKQEQTQEKKVQSKFQHGLRNVACNNCTCAFKYKKERETQ